MMPTFPGRGNINEDILHYGGVRIRVTGAGNLIPTIYSLDNVKSKQLSPFVLAATNYKEPFKLCNFISQRAFLRLEVTQTDEKFNINRVIVFTRPYATQYPGQ